MTTIRPPPCAGCRWARSRPRASAGTSCRRGSPCRGPADGRDRLMDVIDGADQARWEDDGWCLLQGLLPSEAIAAAQAALPALFPSAEEFAADADPARNEPFRVDSHRVMPRFPFDDSALNDLVVHDRIIDLAEQLLGITDLRLYQAMLSAKYSEAASSDEQLLHVDFANHTLG